MDRKSIIVVVVCIGLLIGWHQLMDRLYPRTPAPAPRVAEPADPTQPPVAGTNGRDSSISAAPTSPDGVPRTFAVDTNVQEQLLVISNENARYTFTSHGGGLKLVELVNYPEVPRKKRRGEDHTNGVATLNAFTPAPTLAILERHLAESDGVFTLRQTGDGVTAEKTLENGLTVIKEFQPTTNFLMTATVRLENRSSSPIQLGPQEWVVGTAAPTSPEDHGVTTVGMMWHDGKDKHDMTGASFFSKSRLGCFPRIPPTEYREGSSNVVWAAIHNQFFTLIVMPGQNDVGSEIVSRPIALPRPTADDLRENSRLVRNPEGYISGIVYPAVTLDPNATLQREFVLFAGPKEWRTLARIADRFQNEVDVVMSFGWFGFFSKALLLGMNWVHDFLGIGYGFAIIVITIIIKLLFWPLTQASTRSMKRMQALQPQMKAIQEKYKDDPMKAQRKVMEFMRENKVNPLGGCLPMLLQMPVFIGFFYMIQSAIELRGASFLWAYDLSKPDTIFDIPFLNFPLNPLPLIMGATMLWQAHLTPPSPGMDPMQQKLLRYMPLIFVVFLYNYSAGLALYWTVNNLLTILQTKLTKTNPVPTAAVEPKPPVKRALTPSPKKKK